MADKILSQIKTGKHTTVLETRRYAQGVKVALPILTARGKAPGPVAVISANVHGRELHGIACIEQAWRRIDVKKLRGTVVFAPVMNPVGTRIHQQDYPIEQTRFRPTGIKQCMNINRTLPPERPSCRGTYAEEIGRVFFDAYLRHADFAMDMHGWSGHSLSLVWSHDAALARGFGLPWHMVYRSISPDGACLGNAAVRVGADLVECELSPQNQLDVSMVNHGAQGILNCLAIKGMLDVKVVHPEQQYEFDPEHEEIDLKTPGEGLLVPDRVKGDWVRKGERVLRVLSLETLKPVYEVRAPKDCLVFNIGGIAWGEDMQMNYVVYPGQTVGLLKVPNRIIRYDADDRPVITPVG